MKFIRIALFVMLSILSMRSFCKIFQYNRSKNIVLTYGFDDVYFNSDHFVLTMRKAAKDPKVSGIAINYRNCISSSGDDLNTICDLISVFDLFRNNGKFVDLYATSLEFKTLYLASHAETFLLNESSSNINGLHVYLPFIRNYLRAQGIEVTTISTGEFKNPDPESRTGMSDEYRENLEKMIKVIASILMDDIKSACRIDNEDFMGLHGNDYICDLVSFNKVESFAIWKSKYKNTMSFAQYAHNNKNIEKDKIMIININGNIDNSSYLSSMAFREKIEQLANNKHVKAVILRISSGGGDSNLSFELYNALKVLGSKKLLFASISGVCASGAYVIALSAEKIFASPVSIVGSIGVYTKYAYVKEAGINVEQISSHDMPDWNPNIPLDDRLKKDLINNIKATLQQFRKLVADRRGFNLEYSRQISLGQVYAGRDAVKLGLVDEEGTLLDVINFVQEKYRLGDCSVIFL